MLISAVTGVALLPPNLRDVERRSTAGAMRPPASSTLALRHRLVTFNYSE
jgi:hypothetical protein